MAKKSKKTYIVGFFKRGHNHRILEFDNIEEASKLNANYQAELEDSDLKELDYQFNEATLTWSEFKNDWVIEKIRSLL